MPETTSSQEFCPDTTRHELIVPEGHHEAMRLDRYITGFIQNATRNKVQEGIKSGWVLVNGVAEKASYRVQPGDHIQITIPRPPPPEAVAEEIPIDILFEDEDLIVLDKPPGMVVHPAYGNWTGTLVNALLFHAEKLPAASDQNALRPGVVHRLDKDTSGLLVVAKNDYALHHLARQFALKSVDRVYRALIWGSPADDQGTIDQPLGRDPSNRKKMAVVAHDRGKRAVTHYSVLRRYDHLTLVDVTLETGRTHQIRVHFSWMGHPVFADVVYGGDTIRYGAATGSRKTMLNKLIASLGRQCLHARLLAFEHPRNGEWMSFESEVPADMKLTLAKVEQYCLT